MCTAHTKDGRSSWANLRLQMPFSGRSSISADGTVPSIEGWARVIPPCTSSLSTRCHTRTPAVAPKSLSGSTNPIVSQFALPRKNMPSRPVSPRLCSGRSSSHHRAHHDIMNKGSLGEPLIKSSFEHQRSIAPCTPLSIIFAWRSTENGLRDITRKPQKRPY